jgi:hypothetical protein
VIVPFVGRSWWAWISERSGSVAMNR